MKKTLIILSALFALCAISSCKKEPVNEHPLEGVWGFISDEYVVKNADGTIIDQRKTDYNPFNPSKEGDMKVEFRWISNNDYDTESFEWNPGSNSWISMGGVFKVSIKDGNKFYAERLGGEMEEVGTVTISGDTFVIESSRDMLSIGGTPSGTMYSKETYKRMK